MLGIGIIGCGNVLEAYVPQCHRLRSRGAAEVVIACGRAGQRERALAMGVPLFTTSELDVLTNPQVDVVVILTPMRDHARLATHALESGKHVLMEKPLATTLEEGYALLRAAGNCKGRLVCAPFTTLSPTFRTILGRIQAGDIGKPCLARARYGWAGPSWNEWFYKAGGGSLFDLGVYCITSLTGLLGPVRQVTALAGTAIPERTIHGRTVRVEAEDNTQILLDFGEACFGVVTSGFTMQQYRCPALEIYGTAGTIQMLGDDWDPDGYELWQNSAGCWKVFKETAPDWPWAAGLEHLVECIHENSPPLVTKEQSFHVLEVMVKALDSAQTGMARKIDSRFELGVAEGAPPSEEAPHLAHDRTREHFS